MLKFIKGAGCAIFIFTFLFLFCQEKKEIMGTSENFDIIEVNIPPVLSSTSEKATIFTAKVTHPEGDAGIAMVKLLVTDSLGNSTQEYQMYDDGNAQSHNSGDVIAFDQVYSIILIGSQAGIADGYYSVKVTATAKDGSEKESPSHEMEVFPNQAPEILNVSFPDSIVSGMKPTDILFTVNDNDGLNDILWVLIQGFDSVSSFPVFQDTVFNPLDNSPVFSANIDSSYATNKKGNYTLKFVAEDRVGEMSNIETQQVFFVNDAPEIRWVLVPDTLRLPISGMIVDTIRAFVKDGQTLKDVKSVYFLSQRRQPDGSLGDSSKVSLFDNGNLNLFGDRIADDGEYSRIIALADTNKTGTYVFTFKAKDYVNNSAPVKIDSVIVLSP
jgi:5-hydroxyisourate hydrolase-like protein (transthyretin family)